MVDTINNQNGRDILFAIYCRKIQGRMVPITASSGTDLQIVLRPHARSLAAAAGMASLLALKAIGRRT